VVQERLGHKNISTTLALYAQGTELGHIDASNATQQFLKQNQTKSEVESNNQAN
jgi:integrase